MKNLLAAIDFSKGTESVIYQASQLARALDAKLWILHAASDKAQAIPCATTQFSDYPVEFTTMPGDVQLARDLNAQEIKHEHGALLGISAKLRREGINAQAILLKGSAAKLIIEKSEQFDAEMIILGSHGHGLLHKTFLGSISESVLQHAKCSVLIVPAGNT
ncbi:MAG TPA: universal stress protein [Pontiella sp.]